MEFNKEEYQDMMFNVHELTERQSVLKKFPKLKIFEEFDEERFKKLTTVNLSFDNVLRYIIYVYDKNSPLNKKMDSLLKRKVKALELSGFKRNKNGRWGNHIEKMITCEDKHINSIIIRFLRIHRHSKYAYLRALSESYHKLLEKTVSGELTKNEYIMLNQQQKKIDDLAIEITNEDNTKDLIEDMYMITDYETLDIMPEDIAKILVEGESIL